MCDVRNTETYQFNKLRGRIVERYHTQTAFSEELGITKNAFSRKMTGRTGMSQKDIAQWCQLLDIDKAEIGEYFFS